MVEIKHPAAPVIAEQFAEGMASLHRSTAFWPVFGNSSNKMPYFQELFISMCNSGGKSTNLLNKTS